MPGRWLLGRWVLGAPAVVGVVVVDRNIDVHIRAIRKKLGDSGRLIQTIRGVGYRLVDD